MPEFLLQEIEMSAYVMSYNPSQDIMCYVIIMHKLTYSLSNYMRNYPYNKEICNMSKMCNGNSVFSDCKDCLLE